MPALNKERSIKGSVFLSLILPYYALGTPGPKGQCGRLNGREFSDSHSLKSTIYAIKSKPTRRVKRDTAEWYLAEFDLDPHLPE